MGPKGSSTPAIYSTIAIVWTNDWVMGCAVLSGRIHTCDFLNYCVNLAIGPSITIIIQEMVNVTVQAIAIVGEIAGVTGP